MSFYNPTPNCWRRIQYGENKMFRVPNDVSFGSKSKVPGYIIKEEYIENRYPSCLANPYLLMAAIMVRFLILIVFIV